MNRNDFRSAYDKIVLPEDVKSEMKKKLLAQMPEKGSAQQENSGDFFPATEIKLEPKKRNTGRVVAIVSSAAAIVLAVGAGVWFNRDNLTQQPSTPVATTEESTEGTSEVFIEDEYYMKRTADGILHFQDFTLTDAAHTQPVSQYNDVYNDNVSKIEYKGASEFLERYRLIAKSIGYTALEQASDIWAGRTPDGQSDSSYPLSKDVPLQEIYYSDTGMSLIYRNADGSQQANLCISTDPQEFIPITADGKYLTPVGDWRSFFAKDTQNIIDPETDRMAAGSANIDGVEYYTALYSYKSDDGVTYYGRLDTRNIPQDVFLECLNTGSPFSLDSCHRGYYSDGSDAANPVDGYPDNSYVPIPNGYTASTDYGDLYLNQLTYAFNSGYYIKRWNIQSSGKLGSTDYSLSDMADFSGLDVLNSIDIPIENADAQIDYSAIYDGIYNDEQTPDFGANSEMLPGDDPEEFAEAQQHLNGVLDGDYLESCYTTDKLDYFRNKTRTSAYYTVNYRGDEGEVRLSVLNNWELFRRYTMEFGRYPAKSSPKFAERADGCGKLYAGTGLFENKRYYEACFKINDVYVVLEVKDLSESEFTALLAQIYSNGRAEVKPVQEQGLYTRSTALGELKFQSFTTSTAAHDQPQNSVSAEQALKDYTSDYLNSLRENGYAEYLDGMSVAETYSSDTGAVIVLKNSDGTKQVNFSISSRLNEFMPISLPDGSYIIPEAGRRSKFAMSWINFVSPECFTMAAGSYNYSDDEYFAAEYDYIIPYISGNNDVYHCRIDARNITRDEFISCIDDASKAYLSYDHKGWVNTSGNELDLRNLKSPQTDAVVPDTVTKSTDYGELTYNPVTSYFGHIPSAEWNIMSSSDDTSISEELRYTVSDAAEFGRMDILNSMSPETIFGTSGKTTVSYSAYYDGLTHGEEPLADTRFGANLKSNPQDTPEEFAEAQQYVVKGTYNTNDGEKTYGSHYKTDKISYFDNYDRAGACYEVRFSTDDGQSAHIGIFDDWSLFDEMNLVFARYPSNSSNNFVQGADNFDKLYVGRGYDAWGDLHYVAGWALSSSGSLDKYSPLGYAVLDMSGVSEETFVKTLAELYSNGSAKKIISSDVGTKTALANGELYYQNAGTSDLAYNSPSISCDARTANELLHKYAPNAVIPGTDKYYQSEYKRLTESNIPTEYALDERPLGNILSLESAQYSSTGLALTLTGSYRKVTISVSTRSDEFLPIIRDDGTYLEYTGAYTSRATVNGGYDFIEPQTFQLGVCAGGDGYLAQFELETNGEKVYYRLYSEGLSRDEFEKCLASISPAEPGDHMGNYTPDGSYNGAYAPIITTYEKDSNLMPECTTVQTEWGTLNLNGLTWTASRLDNSHYNVEMRTDSSEIAQSELSYDEISKLSGIGILSDPQKLLGDVVYMGYSAAYDGISSGMFDSDHGVGTEMLPGDDPQQYQEAQEYLSDGYIYDYDELNTPYYTNDRIAYFANKKRTGVKYSLSDRYGIASASITVTDDMRMLDNYNYIFGRTPAESSENFSKAGARVYAGHGLINGNDVYMGGFRSGESYVVVTTVNTGLRRFAELLAALCEDTAAPTVLQAAEYAEPTYTFRDFPDKTYEAGFVYYNPMRMSMPSDADSDAEYYTSESELLADYARLAGNSDVHGNIRLLTQNGWNLDVNNSMKMDFSADGVPRRVSLYFTNGSKTLIVKAGSSYYNDPQRITLSSGKVMYLAGSGPESSLGSYEKVVQGKESSAFYQLSICGRTENGIPYHVAQLNYNNGSRLMSDVLAIEGSDLDIGETMDILAMLVYGIDKMP